MGTVEMAQHLPTAGTFGLRISPTVLHKKNPVLTADGT
jgi:hypothetical protein